MTDRFNEGPCSCCGVEALLVRGGHLGTEPVCAVCTFMAQAAPKVIANALKARQNTVTIEGTTIHVHSPLALSRITRKMAEMHRREERGRQRANSF